MSTQTVAAETLVAQNKVLQEKLQRNRIKSERRLIDSLFPSSPASPKLWKQSQKVKVNKCNLASFSKDEFVRVLALAAAATVEQNVDEVLALQPTKTFAIIEFCCDYDSEVGRQCDKLGIPCLRITKDDPCQELATIQKCVRFIDKYDRVHMHGSLPCTAWSLLQYLNVHLHGLPFVRRLRRARILSLFQVASFLIVARLIKTKGGTVSFEWPKTAEGWKQPLVEQMIHELKLQTAFCDGCAVGVFSRRTGEAILKPWRFETDNDILREELNAKRCTKDHPHTPCEGGEAGKSGHYPEQLAEIIVQGGYNYHLRQTAMEAKLQKEKDDKVFEIEMIAVATADETKAFLDLSAKARQKLVDAARKVHINTGHKPPADLARLLRQMNAPPASRAAMESIKCSTCAEHKRPEPSPVVELGRESVPFKYISWDIKDVLDRKNDMKHKFLVIICDATRFARVIKLFSIKKNEHRNAKTSEVLEAFESGWEEIFGLPEELRHDPEGAFVSNELIEKFSKKGVQLKPVAGEAHWQNGLCERAIQSIFTAATRISSEENLPIPRAVALATS